MRERSYNQPKPTQGIKCLEVLISKSSIEKCHNLHWTLSVYSLENQPIKKLRSLHNSEIFHFMVFDWERTIMKMLEENQIPYSIVQHFSREHICSTETSANLVASDQEAAYLQAVEELESARPNVLLAGEQVREKITADSF